MAADSTSSWATVHDFLQNCDNRAANCFRRTQWEQLCIIASNANRRLDCIPLDQVASGLNHVVRLLEFSDRSRWAARVSINATSSLEPGNARFESEIATMQFIEEHSNLVVPRIFAYALNDDNPAAVAYMLIEVLPGIVAMDALGGYEVHRGVIPVRYRQPFYRSVATCQVQITSLRLPMIGTVIRNREGRYESGPLPGIGGPFRTATAFFEAWADKVKFRWDEETIRRYMQRTLISGDQMIRIISQFPSQIRAMAGQLSSNNHGPFPLRHDDFLHSNIMVDENSFDVTGIIDWEGACTVPWELIGFPEFLQVMPASFDFPEKYDKDGQPLDDEMRQKWDERLEYIEMVKSAERQDNLLSVCLSNSRNQALAYILDAFSDVGKLGFYDRVMEEVAMEN